MSTTTIRTKASSPPSPVCALPSADSSGVSSVSWIPKDASSVSTSAAAETPRATESGPASRATLVWSPSRGRPLLSLDAVMRVHAEDNFDAWREYTASRRFALLCHYPPEGLVVNRLCKKLGDALWNCNQTTFESVYALESGSGMEGKKRSWSEFKTDTVKSLLCEATERWDSLRVAFSADLARLDEHMKFYKDVNTSVSLQQNYQRYRGTREAMPANVHEWLSEPPLRMPTMSGLTNSPSRSAKAREWLKWLRAQRFDTAPAYGRALSSWPAWTAAAMPADHVVPVRSLSMGAALIDEHGDATQNPINLVLCTSTQNTAKSDHSLGIFSRATEQHGASGQGVYFPKDVSDAKRAMLAKAVAAMFALYWGVRVACRARARRVAAPRARVLAVRRHQRQEALRQRGRVLCTGHRHRRVRTSVGNGHAARGRGKGSDGG